jgi:hypothetical protein
MVLNAGSSSSIKFSMFAVDPRAPGLALRYRNAIDGLGSDPRFFVADADGRRVVDHAVSRATRAEPARSPGGRHTVSRDSAGRSEP